MATFKFYLDKPFIESPEVKEQIKELKRQRKEIPTSFLSDKETAIYLYIIVDRNTIKLRTQERILPKHWNFNQQNVRKSHSNSANFNIRLRDFKDKIVNLHAEHMKSGDDKSIAGIRKALQNHNAEKNVSKRENTFFEVFDSFLAFRSNTLKEGTIKKFKSLQKHLVSFESHLRKNSKLVYISSGTKIHNIEFKHIDKDFIEELKNYLSSEKNLLSDTLYKYLEGFKIFLAWSFDRKAHSNTIFKEIEIQKPKNKNDKIYLTTEEFYRIYDLDLSHDKTLDLVRDIFCLQTLTGQRISDIMGLRWGDIVTNEGGRIWSLYQTKGFKEKRLNITLVDDALAILDKYHAKRATHEKVFPYVSNPTANKYIKDVAKLAEINSKITIRRNELTGTRERTAFKYEFVTTHTARVTFVTLSLEKGMRQEVVMAQTGHEDFKTMKIYQQLVDKVKHQEVKADSVQQSV